MECCCLWGALRTLCGRRTDAGVLGRVDKRHAPCAVHVCHAAMPVFHMLLAALTLLLAARSMILHTPRAALLFALLLLAGSAASVSFKFVKHMYHPALLPPCWHSSKSIMQVHHAALLFTLLLHVGTVACHRQRHNTIQACLSVSISMPYSPAFLTAPLGRHSSLPRAASVNHTALLFTQLHRARSAACHLQLIQIFFFSYIAAPRRHSSLPQAASRQASDARAGARATAAWLAAVPAHPMAWCPATGVNALVCIRVSMRVCVCVCARALCKCGTGCVACAQHQAVCSRRSTAAVLYGIGTAGAGAAGVVCVYQQGCACRKRRVGSGCWLIRLRFLKWRDASLLHYVAREAWSIWMMQLELLHLLNPACLNVAKATQSTQYTWVVYLELLQTQNPTSCLNTAMATVGTLQEAYRECGRAKPFYDSCACRRAI
eukprot:scaffold23575_cov21-Tisochrysis_lutea.AAC.1